jgi:pilus assembly protein CpaC
MTKFSTLKSGFVAAAISAALATTALVAAPNAFAAPASAESGKLIVLSIGRGQQLNLPTAITDVVISNPGVADVEVKSARQLYILGKGPGETTFYATDAAGKTVYRAIIRVGQNLDSLDQMLGLAMPDANIQITTMNGSVLLTGTVRQPEDAEEAVKLVEAFTGGGTVVISRLKNATPLQVNLRVRIAEVSRSLSKAIAGNLATRDSSSNGFVYAVGSGRNFVDITGGTGAVDISNLPVLDASSTYGLPAGTINLPFDPVSGKFIANGGAPSPTLFNFKTLSGSSLIAAAGRLFGMDVAAGFDVSERAGLISTLAEPNLTTVSGETAEFRSGGQYPFPVSSGLGATGVEFKNFGVSLQYTPTVLSDGRISLRVRPEVSEISSQGAVRINGNEVPALTQRMADTTVELGSGQSFMIAGLLQNTSASSVDKLPGAGDIPVLGALFKSNGWRKNETELMIIVTPYLVKPVSDSEIKLPTDGYNSPNDIERVLLNKVSSPTGGDTRPMPTVAPEAKGPEFGSVSEPGPAIARKAPSATAQASAPGFTFDK